MPVPSPCINVCVLDPVRGLCLGCARTSQEIGDWIHLDDAGKLAVWARIDARRARGEAPPPPAPRRGPDVSGSGGAGG